jgi:imidazoleglycerol-phosphate dehydratase
MNHKIRVLIADDSVEARENAAKLLILEPDIEVVELAGSGREALERAHLLHPDVVLMDINMPEMDGIAATKALSADLPNVAVVILSIHDELDVVRSAMLAGARGYLVKPPSADTLARTVREVHGLAHRQEQDWLDQPAHEIGPAFRQARLARATRETQIHVTLDLDGSGQGTIGTGVPFFDHLLITLARHARFDLEIKARGELTIDDHHVIEDVGNVLGQALRQAVGNRAGMARFGHAYAPVDEALARVVIDLSGRPYLAYNTPGLAPTLGGLRVFHTDLIEEFWRALATHAALTLHIDLLRGGNAHHSLEACAKAAALALHQATRKVGPANMAPATGGVL